MWMRGSLRSAGFGLPTSKHSSGTWTAWIGRRQRQKRKPPGDAPKNPDGIAEKRNENQTHQHFRGRSGEGAAVLYGHPRLRQESRFQSGPISLADGSLPGRPGRYRAAAGEERQPDRESTRL